LAESDRALLDRRPCHRRSAEKTQAGAGNPLNLPELLRRPAMRRVLTVDFVYWFSFAIFQTPFALFAARRFGFDVSRTGHFFAGFGLLGAVIQGGFVRPIVKRTGDKPLKVWAVRWGQCGATRRFSATAKARRSFQAPFVSC